MLYDLIKIDHRPEELQTDLEPLLESMVRVSLAGFGGFVVGLAYQKKDEALRQQLERELQQFSKYSSYKGKRFSKRTAPPRPSGASAMSYASGAPRNRAFSWFVSCSFFALLPETTRLVSPTKRLFELYDPSLSDPLPSASDPSSQLSESASSSSLDGNVSALMQKNHLSPGQRYFASVSDYTIGGALSGVAGGVAFKRRVETAALPFANAPNIPKTFGGILGWAVGLGVMIGFAGGLVIASGEAIKSYATGELQDEKDGEQVCKEEENQTNDSEKP